MQHVQSLRRQMDEINATRAQVTKSQIIRRKEISSYSSNEFTVITRHGEFNEMAVDCPDMTSTLMTNDSSEFVTADMSSYPPTVEQQQQQQEQQEQFQTMPTNISSFFASNSHGSDSTNLFRMKKNNIDSNTHACMCGHGKANILSGIMNANSSKKSTIHVKEMFRRIKSSFASSTAVKR